MLGSKMMAGLASGALLRLGIEGPSPRRQGSLSRGGRQRVVDLIFSGVEAPENYIHSPKPKSKRALRRARGKAKGIKS